jgi:hypothetical protein
MTRYFYLAGLCFCLLQNATIAQKPEAQITELRAKITKWQTNQDKLKTLLEQMRKDKIGILEKLVQLGIRSKDDLIGNQKGQVLHGELKDIVRQMAIYDKKYQDYELAIFKCESRLRSIARQLSAREAGLSQADLNDLTRSMVTLDESEPSEKDSAVPAMDVHDTLKEELTRYWIQTVTDTLARYWVQAHANPKPEATIPSVVKVPTDPPRPEHEKADELPSQSVVREAPPVEAKAYLFPFNSVPLTTQERKQWLLAQYARDFPLTPTQIARAKDKLDELSPEEISDLVTDYRHAKQKKWLLATYADLGLTPSQLADEKEKLDDSSPGQVNAMVSPASPSRNQPYQGPTTVVTENNSADVFIANDEYAPTFPPYVVQLAPTAYSFGGRPIPPRTSAPSRQTPRATPRPAPMHPRPTPRPTFHPPAHSPSPSPMPHRHRTP